MATHYEVAQKFHEDFKICIRALLDDSVQIGEYAYWCYWSNNNEVYTDKIGLNAGNYSETIKGLERLGIITSLKVNDLPQDPPEAWLNQDNIQSRNIYRIENRKQLEAFCEECPTENLSNWKTYSRFQQAIAPPKIGFDATLKNLVEMIKETENPEHWALKAIGAITRASQ